MIGTFVRVCVCVCRRRRKEGHVCMYVCVSVCACVCVRAVDGTPWMKHQRRRHRFLLCACCSASLETMARRSFSLFVAVTTVLLAASSATAKSGEHVSAWANMLLLQRASPVAAVDKGQSDVPSEVDKLSETPESTESSLDKMHEVEKNDLALLKARSAIDQSASRGPETVVDDAFNAILEKAEAKEESLKKKKQIAAEKIRKEKEHNETIRVSEERNKGRRANETKRRAKEAHLTLRREQTAKLDAKIRIEKAKKADTLKRDQARALKVLKKKRKWLMDKFKVLNDHRKMMIVDQATGMRSCSQNGMFNNITHKCACNTGYFGPVCSYKRLYHPSHARKHGRFSGLSACENGGTPLEGGGCNCTEHFHGFHCHFKKCVHGKYSCPAGRKFCLRQRCVCEKGWFGSYCEHKHVAPPPPCQGQIQSCDHDGVFSNATCQCECSKPWAGKHCEVCDPSSVPRKGKKGQFVVDPRTCTLKRKRCPSTLSCSNHGHVDQDSCTCTCNTKFSGKKCEVCRERSCHGKGVFDKRSCGCLCEVPFKAQTDCATCEPMDCGLHGKFDPVTCKCKCYGGWTGLVCDMCEKRETCPENHIFDEVECKCSKHCEPLTCAHGGVQDPESCECSCNAQNIPKSERTKDLAVQEFQKLVSARFGPASPVAKAVKESIGQMLHDTITKAQMLDQLKSFTATTKFADVSASLVRLREALGVPSAGKASDGHLRTTVSTSTKSLAHASFKESLASLLPSLVFLQADEWEAENMSNTDNSTYWSGATCEKCHMPHPSPCEEGAVFDMGKCACANECPKPLAVCQHGGNLNEMTCRCTCPVGFTGRECEIVANGLTKESAVHSCKELLEANPDTPSGGYWLKPRDHRGEPFLTRCDMILDGGGWTQVARVKQSVGVHFDAMSYVEGMAPKNADGLRHDFIMPCDRFDGLDGNQKRPLRNFIMRVTIGYVRDFFKPVEGSKASFCELISSHDKHLWSANGGGLASHIHDDFAAQANTGWLQPEYSQLKELNVLGGSNESWPMQIDGRKYLGIWGGYKGGCCHTASNLYRDPDGNGVDDGGWSQEFEIHVLEVPPKNAGLPNVARDDADETLFRAKGEKKVEAMERDDEYQSPAGTKEIPVPNMLTKKKTKGEFMKGRNKAASGQI